MIRCAVARLNVLLPVIFLGMNADFNAGLVLPVLNNNL
jgi:hypothetical protein